MNHEATDEISSSDPGNWKRQLRDSLNTMVDSLPQELPSISNQMDHQGSSEPSLEEFYHALIALEANTRKNVQKTNASLESVAKNLRALQVQFSTLDEKLAKNARNDHESLINLNGQFLRMIESVKSPPPPAPLGLSRKWEKAWSDLISGIEILHRSIINTLNEYGIRMETPEIGSPFDPQTMQAVQVHSTSEEEKAAVVASVVEPAYYQNGVAIRNARVYVEK